MRVLVLFALTAAVVTLVGPAAAAPVPKHLMKEAEGGDKAKLQGKWRVQSITFGGRNAEEPLRGSEMVIEFRGDKLIATTTGATNRSTTGTVEFGANGTKRFTTVETTTADGGGAPRTEQDEAFGFAFDGDKLLLGVSPGAGGKEAPDPLKPGPGDGVIVLVRVK